MDGRGVRNPECRDGEPITDPVRVDGVGKQSEALVCFGVGWGGDGSVWGGFDNFAHELRDAQKNRGDAGGGAAGDAGCAGGGGSG